MKANHLSSEKSPYLLQHANNPIDWYPWGEEAFQKAQKEDKPIFLSIGYSTCHWCHVMAHESFEDEEVAAYMNEHYVAIKVDREERPDIDSLYMKVCQMMTGQGGWPLTIVMTPDQTPYYAGTYFPRVGRHGLPGIMEVLSQLSKIYKNDKNKIAEIKESVHGALQQTIQKKSDRTLSGDTVVKAYQEMVEQFDSVFGGFGVGQKFPQPHNLLFLLHYYQTTKEEKALHMVEHTLDKMLSGGIWDHIGFGFSRYTVDRRWQTPHFEKMLYDNALLLLVLTTCYQITKKTLYQTTADQLVTFLEREMKAEEGAFYSAIDADSEGEEGKFYVWDFLEFYQTLDEEKANQFVERHRITTRGNFEGKTIIQGPPVDEETRLQLLAEREKRVRPHTDDKILTSWNSLLIAALARASKVFENDAYLSLALEATAFIEEKLTQDGRLMARYRDGETKHKAYLDDYAFLSWAYLELYEATYDLNVLKKALKTVEEMERLFWDEAEGGFFFSGRDGEQLLIRDKEVSEGAMPSGNGMASMVYAKLAKLTGETHYTDRLYALYQLFYRDIERAPSASPSLLQSLLFSEYPGKEVVIIGNDHYFMKKLSENYLPNTVVLVADNAEAFENVAEFARLYPQVNNETTIYVCENFVCQRPTNDSAKALEMLIY